MTEIIFEQFNKDFDITQYNFDSGISIINNFLFNELNDYLKENYLQAYLLKDEKKKKIIGYLTLSAASLHRNSKETKKRFKKRGYIPAILVGRLGIDKDFRRKKFGTFLMLKAQNIGIEISKSIGCKILIADARTTRETLYFYLKLKFKFIDLNSALTIIKKLRQNENVNKTLKMYLDLNN